MHTESFAEAWQVYQAAKTRFHEARERLLASFLPRILGLTRCYLRDRSQQEDVRGSVLVSFFANHKDEFEKIQQPGELWELFAAITVRHCNKHNKRRQRENQRGPVVPIGPAGSSAGAGGGFEPADSELAPDEKAIEREVQGWCRDLIEQCERVLAQDDMERGTRRFAVLGMHLEGKSRHEIALALKTSVPTVDRDFKEIRTVLDKLRAEQEDG